MNFCKACPLTGGGASAVPWWDQIYGHIKENIVMKYICTICGHEYDEAAEGVPFNELPEDWVCPVCGVGKELFKPEQ